MAVLREQVRLRRVPRARLVSELRDLPRYLSGRLPDVHRYGAVFKAHLARALMEKIYQAFLLKSRGGTDDAGYRWKPLKRETLAYRADVPCPLTHGRGLLTAEQDRLWRGIFASNYARLSAVMGEAEAKAQAARIAWGILKAQGARTKLAAYGNRKAPILYVTGRLARSLQPGRVSGGRYHPPREQVYEAHRQHIVIGSRVPYAPYVHRQRPLWPSSRRIGPWLAEATEKALQELTREMSRTLSKELAT
ncbi:MAG: hypothetical protein JRI66_09185 [Deltaproteobacteria bacterium]|nr:hypothetical protein [Deltaproteobacteria bacterium]